MPKIEIRELDLTTPGVNAEDFNVVYIPGFVDIRQRCLYNSEGTYIGLEVNTPTLFTSVNQFETLCGPKGAVFDSVQDYRSLNTENAEGFAPEAVPYHNIMFRKGEMDPSYIMAKELLSAGLNVLYERVNGDGEYIPVTSQPADWDTSYSQYSYEAEWMDLIKSSVAPGLYKRMNFGDVIDLSTIYYKGVEDASGNITYDSGRPGSTLIGDTDENTAGVQYLDGITVSPTDSSKYIFTGEGATYYVKNNFYSIEAIAGVTESEAELTIEGKSYYRVTTLPTDWAVSYYVSYYEKASEMRPVNSLTAEVPAFSSLKNVCKFDDSISIAKMYRALSAVYESGSREGLSDRGNFSIKYLTSGGYPTYEYNKNSICTAMMALAEKRGDCVAFIDHTDNLYRQSNIDLPGSVYYTVNNDVSISQGEYGTMFTPWASYNRTTTDKETDAEGKSIIVQPDGDGVRMSATYAYLVGLADSIKTNAPWLAIAGAARGPVLNLAQDGMTTNIPNGVADAMQPRSASEQGSGRGIAVNAITNIKPYGYIIWGNRTLKPNAENLVATSFLNIRNLVSDVKKTCYRAARKLTFEQNNDILWVNFKAEIAPTLDRMLSGYGISGYKIVRDLQHEKAAEKATLCAKIILYPVYAVEDFYITIVLKDDEVTIE